MGTKFKDPQLPDNKPTQEVVIVDQIDIDIENLVKIKNQALIGGIEAEGKIGKYLNHILDDALSSGVGEGDEVFSVDADMAAKINQAVSAYAKLADANKGGIDELDRVRRNTQRYGDFDDAVNFARNIFKIAERAGINLSEYKEELLEKGGIPRNKPDSS